MYLFLKKLLLCFGFFYVYVILIVWIFIMIEKRDEFVFKRKEELLSKFRNDMNKKYNIIDDDFNSFVNCVVVVVIEGDELDWILFNSFIFVLIIFIIIGKRKGLVYVVYNVN